MEENWSNIGTCALDYMERSRGFNFQSKITNLRCFLPPPLSLSLSISCLVWTIEVLDSYGILTVVY